MEIDFNCILKMINTYKVNAKVEAKMRSKVILYVLSSLTVYFSQGCTSSQKNGSLPLVGHVQRATSSNSDPYKIPRNSSFNEDSLNSPKNAQPVEPEVAAQIIPVNSIPDFASFTVEDNYLDGYDTMVFDLLRGAYLDCGESGAKFGMPPHAFMKTLLSKSPEDKVFHLPKGLLIFRMSGRNFGGQVADFLFFADRSKKIVKVEYDLYFVDKDKKLSLKKSSCGVKYHKLMVQPELYFE